MVLLALLVIPLACGMLVVLAALRYPRVAGAPHLGDVRIGEVVRTHGGLRRLLQRRLDPIAATGLALTVSLVLIVGAGILIGLFAYLVRTETGLVRFDARVGQWGVDHATSFTTDLVELLTHLGDTGVVLVLAGLLAVVEYVRMPSRWIVPFLGLVVLGQVLVTNGLKEMLDRVRPEFNPVAATLGPSFPSGHSALAAAFFAAAALLLGRGRGPTARAFLAGGAVAIAVTVACTRVLLGVHWMSDVMAGLALGWAWFAVCSIAFGGRLLTFGRPVEVAEREASSPLRAAYMSKTRP